MLNLFSHIRRFQFNNIKIQILFLITSFGIIFIYYSNKFYSTTFLRRYSYLERKYVTTNAKQSETFCHDSLAINNWTLPTREGYPKPFYDTSVLFVDYWGRLGNNMFQLASCVGIASWYNRTPLISANNPLLKIFLLRNVKTINDSIKTNSSMTHWIQLGSNIAAGFDSNINKSGLKVDYNGKLVLANEIVGYLQSPMYFGHVKNLIKCNFKFLKDTRLMSQRILSQVKAIFYSKAQPQRYFNNFYNKYRNINNYSTQNLLTEILQNGKSRLLDDLGFKNIRNSIYLSFDPSNLTWLTIEKNVSIRKQFPTNDFNGNFSIMPNIGDDLKIINVLINPNGVILDNLNINKAFNFISVHVRRGDFINNGGRPIQTKRWLFESMNIMNRSHTNPIFIMGSDDIDWCIKNTALFPFNIAYLNNTPEIDFAVLAQCNHSIFGYSSYGWWAAYLAEGDVIYMKENTLNRTWWSTQIRPQEYFLPEWQAL